jgi:hypothetical protein
MTNYRKIKIDDTQFHAWCMQVQIYQEPLVVTRIDNLLITIQNEFKNRHIEPLFGTKEQKIKIIRSVIRIMCRNVRLYQKFLTQY